MVIGAVKVNVLVQGPSGGYRRSTADVDALTGAAPVDAEITAAEVRNVQRRSGRILADGDPIVSSQTIVVAFVRWLVHVLIVVRTTAHFEPDHVLYKMFSAF